MHGRALVSSALKGALYRRCYRCIYWFVYYSNMTQLKPGFILYHFWLTVLVGLYHCTRTEDGNVPRLQNNDVLCLQENG